MCSQIIIVTLLGLLAQIPFSLCEERSLILIMGGFRGDETPHKDVFLFNKEDSSLSKCLGNVSPYIVEGSLGAFLKGSEGHYFLSCGGKGPDNAGKCFKYFEGKWKRISTMFRQYETGGSGVQLSQSAFMITGGHHIYSMQEYPDRDSEVYQGNKWISGPSLPYGLTHHCAIQIDSNTTMIIGGEIQNRVSPRTFLYNWNSDSWESGPELNIGRSHHSCGIHKGKVIITGGEGEDDKLTLNVTEIFDPQLNKMFFGPKLNVSMTRAAMVSLSEDELYLIGGYSSNTPIRVEPVKQILQYQDSGYWEEILRLPEAMYQHSAYPVPTGFRMQCDSSATELQVFQFQHYFIFVLLTLNCIF